ncbi:MAG TPA: 5'/3'-nucleotidase SurE [Thermodesulfobacteriaceae bacterium]|nr:5'/3'-nucleotidase SurE [Thermodesulfobacteriaceae bacterium]
MRILLTNDDGIHALGICALYEALRDDHEIFLVAPDSERSAVGHAITLVDPLRARKVRRNGGFFGWALSGTPADCVKLGCRELIDGPVDMVVSGINLGANTGINVLYSGTVSAATEGTILGIRSAAFSLDTFQDPNYCFAASFAGDIVNWFGSLELERPVALNVNIPSLPPARISGVRVVRQDTSQPAEDFDKRIDPRGNVYYWQADQNLDGSASSDTDRSALGSGFITITPIRFDLTDHELLGALAPPGI